MTPWPHVSVSWVYVNILKGSILESVLEVLSYTKALKTFSYKILHITALHSSLQCYLGS